MRVTLGRRFTFRAAHRCWRPDWDEEQNRRAYGPCATHHPHGHTFTLEIVITGPVDSDTGMIVNVTDLKAWVTTVLKSFDYGDLNSDIPEFRENVPSLENIAAVLAERIRSSLPAGITLQRLRLSQDSIIFTEVTSEKV